MLAGFRKQAASAEAARRRNRESTYTEPLSKKNHWEKQTDEELQDLKAFLADFYRTIYKRRDECSALLQEHPKTLGVYYHRLVPQHVSYEDFWQRYFYRCEEQHILQEWERQGQQSRQARADAIAGKMQSAQKFLTKTLSPPSTPERNDEKVNEEEGAIAFSQDKATSKSGTANKAELKDTLSVPTPKHETPLFDDASGASKAATEKMVGATSGSTKQVTTEPKKKKNKVETTKTSASQRQEKETNTTTLKYAAPVGDVLSEVGSAQSEQPLPATGDESAEKVTENHLVDLLKKAKEAKSELRDQHNPFEDEAIVGKHEKEEPAPRSASGNESDDSSDIESVTPMALKKRNEARAKKKQQQKPKPSKPISNPWDNLGPSASSSNAKATIKEEEYESDSSDGIESVTPLVLKKRNDAKTKKQRLKQSQLKPISNPWDNITPHPERKDESNNNKESPKTPPPTPNITKATIGEDTLSLESRLRKSLDMQLPGVEEEPREARVEATKQESEPMDLHSDEKPAKQAPGSDTKETTLQTKPLAPPEATKTVEEKKKSTPVLRMWSRSQSEEAAPPKPKAPPVQTTVSTDKEPPDQTTSPTTDEANLLETPSSVKELQSFWRSKVKNPDTRAKSSATTPQPATSEVPVTRAKEEVFESSSDKPTPSRRKVWARFRQNQKKREEVKTETTKPAVTEPAKEAPEVVAEEESPVQTPKKLVWRKVQAPDSLEKKTAVRDEATKLLPFKLNPYRIIGAAIALLLALLVMVAHQYNLLSLNSVCAPVMPQTTLSEQNVALEAPWWAPQPVKPIAFSVFCGDKRPRTRLEWTLAKKRGSTFHNIVVTSLSSNEEKKPSRPLFEKRQLKSVLFVNGESMNVTNKKGVVSTVKSPWML